MRKFYGMSSCAALDALRCLQQVVKPLLFVTLLCLVITPLGATCTDPGALAPFGPGTDWVAELGVSTVNGSPTGTALVTKFEFRNPASAGTLLGTGEATFNIAGFIEQRSEVDVTMSVDLGGDCTTGTFSEFNNFETVVASGVTFTVDPPPAGCPPLPPPGTPVTLCPPTPGGGPGTTLTFRLSGVPVGKAWLLSAGAALGSAGSPRCVSTTDRLQQIPSPSTWALSGRDVLFRDNITFSTNELLMGWRLTGVLSGSETITDGTFNPCAPGSPSCSMPIVVVQGGAVSGIYDVFPDPAPPQAVNFYPPFVDGNHGACFGARFSIGGNPPASQSFDYLGYFFPPYDSSGRPVNWVGVDVNTQAPNSLGNAFLGNAASAHRTSP